MEVKVEEGEAVKDELEEYESLPIFDALTTPGREFDGNDEGVIKVK